LLVWQTFEGLTVVRACAQHTYTYTAGARAAHGARALVRNVRARIHLRAHERVQGHAPARRGRRENMAVSRPDVHMTTNRAPPHPARRNARKKVDDRLSRLPKFGSHFLWTSIRHLGRGEFDFDRRGCRAHALCTRARCARVVYSGAHVPFSKRSAEGRHPPRAQPEKLDVSAFPAGEYSFSTFHFYIGESSGENSPLSHRTLTTSARPFVAGRRPFVVGPFQARRQGPSPARRNRHSKWRFSAPPVYV